MLKKILVSAVLVLLLCVPAYAVDAVYNRDRPSEVVGWTLFGADDDIDTTAELITELDTTYAQLAAEDNIEIVSASDDDVTQSITVTGIDEYGKKISETLEVSGTSAITSSATFRYVDQVYTDAPMLYTLTVRRATGNTFITSIPAGAMQAGMAQHFNGEKDTYLTYWKASVTSTTGSVIFDLRWYPDDSYCLAPTTGYYLIDQIVLTNELSSDNNWFAQPVKLPYGGYLAIYGTGGQNNSDGSVTLQGYDTIVR